MNNDWDEEDQPRPRHERAGTGSADIDAVLATVADSDEVTVETLEQAHEQLRAALDGD